MVAYVRGQQRMSTLGTALERVEDAALLMGRGRYIDDMPVAPGTGHAAILRSPHPHARLVGIDTAAAEAMPGVHTVVTGGGRARLVHALHRQRAPAHGALVHRHRPSALRRRAGRHRCSRGPLPGGGRARADRRALRAAGGRRRSRGDAGSRTRRCCTRPWAATSSASGRSATASRRRRSPTAAHTVATTVRYPRNSCTPIECLGLIAAYDPGEHAYDVLSHFQGPMTLHPVMARALKVPGPRLRLRSVPDSGGSFGVKQAVFPLIVAMALAARKAARPVKWIEDRLEHLLAANIGDQPGDADRGCRGGRRQGHGAPPRSAGGLRRLPEARPSPRRSTATTATSPAPTASPISR